MNGGLRNETESKINYPFYAACQRAYAFAVGGPFSSPEAVLLLISTKNHDLWPGPTPEVRDLRTSRHSAHSQSQVWQICLVLGSIYCIYKAIQNRNLTGPIQRSRFLVLTKRSAASGEENVDSFTTDMLMLKLVLMSSVPLAVKRNLIPFLWHSCDKTLVSPSAISLEIGCIKLHLK